ncbi:hypothetical protein BRADI_4g14234v3 [Brachypodium distachyon]|uniref:Secreted protein n=1 Tax=Brachypodium distachyon TaxID=15368 RepID=A0A2K2CMR1_BRADI|nr:hypothetical protein BRADI_4g14234v3 [Brachypodium distachyon]
MSWYIVIVYPSCAALVATARAAHAECSLMEFCRNNAIYMILSVYSRRNQGGFAWVECWSKKHQLRDNISGGEETEQLCIAPAKDAINQQHHRTSSTLQP